MTNVILIKIKRYVLVCMERKGQKYNKVRGHEEL